MDSDLRAAAEQLLESGMGAIDRPPWVAKAVMGLARAYLADNPADDDTPLDEGWVASVLTYSSRLEGYVLRYDDNSPIVLDMTGSCEVPECAVWVDHGDASSPIANPRTRGDLRRLAAALGIPLGDSR